jgi:hypothetical protein
MINFYKFLEESDIEVATIEIFRFIAGLKAKGIVTAVQGKLLEENIEDR